MVASLIEQLKLSVIEGRIEEVPKITQAAVDARISLQEIVDQGLIPAMDIIGEMFNNGDLFVPEMLLSARTMQSSMNILRPLIVGGQIKPRGVAVFGTVQGDVHDIGKNLVIMMMEGAGFEVHDLGVNVAPEKFSEAVESKRPTLCCMSALLSTTQDAMGETISFFDKKGIRNRVKFMVGGAAITESFAAEIGAEGYAPDAPSAVLKAKELVELRRK